MSARLHILTGASRGLGAAMAEQLLGTDTTLLCISRHVNVALAAKAEAAPAQLEQWSRDLSDPLPVARQVEGWLHTFDAQQFDEAVLINNAGVITRIGPVDAGADEELSAALRVGLEAAMLLTRAFLRATLAWRARRGCPARPGGGGPRAGSARARCSTSRPAWAAARWQAARSTAPPRPAWTTFRARSRSTRRIAATPRASCRWRRA
jgi:NAD(P)-dependent dehydrogenase (short-subunit alcohol dehydrogenase family)